MNAITGASRQRSDFDAWIGIVLGGCIAASLDLAFAFAFYGLHGVAPESILQDIASGLLGVQAFRAGAAAAALGLVCHYLILVCAAAFYAFAGRYIEALKSHASICGMLFGGAIYLFMHYVVVPLSAAPAFKPVPGAIWGELASHLFLVGLPIALSVRRFGTRNQ